MQCADQNFFFYGEEEYFFFAISFVGRVGGGRGLFSFSLNFLCVNFSGGVPSPSISAHSFNLILEIQIKMPPMKTKYKEGPALHVLFSADSRHGLITSCNMTRVTDLHLLPSITLKTSIAVYRLNICKHNFMLYIIHAFTIF